MEEENRLDDFLSKYKLPLAAGLVGLVLLIGGISSSGLISKTFSKPNKYPQNNLTQAQSGPKVDVSGAVVRPGVYALSSASRVEDAIKAAGGVTETADPVYLTKTVNLAQKVADGMKIYIPVAGEAGTSGQVAGAQAANQGGLININTAPLADLDKLPSVGPKIGQDIIDKRPYNDLKELLTKKAVTSSVYDKIKGLVSVY